MIYFILYTFALAPLFVWWFARYWLNSFGKITISDLIAILLISILPFAREMVIWGLSDIGKIVIYRKKSNDQT